ncbi:MAG TPA: hypothetical protein VHN18_10425 [Micromonosporaceae bacterium]|nr:hypothetical protein [Micromonosporaceae bacterium]
MRVPTSVLLAVLAAAALLALAPALVRRYDATERLVAERAESSARVLERRQRRRTVPGRRPVNAARRVVTRSEERAPARRSRRDRPLRVVSGPPARAPRRPYPTAVYRRRRVLAALLLLNVAELAGVVLVGPGFWIGFAVTGTLLATYVVHLRRRAVRERRRQRAQAREAAWLAARQAEVRRQQARRAAARREAQRRMAAEREAIRRTAMGLDRLADLPAAAVGGSISYRPAAGRRERS